MRGSYDRTAAFKERWEQAVIKIDRVISVLNRTFILKIVLIAMKVGYILVRILLYARQSTFWKPTNPIQEWRDFEQQTELATYFRHSLQ